MMAAAELAAVRLKDIPSTNSKLIEMDRRDRVFCLLDKNGDGKISIEELTEVMEELGAQGEDAREMMQLLDSNSDGSLSSDEFDMFQKQVNAFAYYCDWLDYIACIAIVGDPETTACNKTRICKYMPILRFCDRCGGLGLYCP